MRCTALIGCLACLGSERRAGLSIHIIYIMCRRAAGIFDSERRAWRSIHSYIPCRRAASVLGSRQCLAARGGPGKGRATGGERRAGQWGVLGGKRRAGQWAGDLRACQAAFWAVGGLLACLAASGVLGIALGGRLA